MTIYTGTGAMHSAFGHIGGSRRCREANMGISEVRIPFGSRDTMVGGSGAAQPRHGSSSTGPIELSLRGNIFISFS